MRRSLIVSCLALIACASNLLAQQQIKECTQKIESPHLFKDSTQKVCLKSWTWNKETRMEVIFDHPPEFQGIRVDDPVALQRAWNDAITRGITVNKVERSESKSIATHSETVTSTSYFHQLVIPAVHAAMPIATAHEGIALIKSENK